MTTFIEMRYDAGAPTVTPDVLPGEAEGVIRLSRVDVALLVTLKKEGKPGDGSLPW